MAEDEEAIKYAYEWYSSGRYNKDPMIRFVMDWIAFNWLYSEIEGEGDWWKVKEYCKNHHDVLERYPAFDTTWFQTLTRSPVKSMRRNKVVRKNTQRHRDLIEGTGDDRIVDLFDTIYTVRCNLFHGSKRRRSMLVGDDGERDNSIVEASAAILEGYLDKLFDEYGY